MATLQELEIEIEKIKDRNSRVEKEKNWETSWTRKLLIAILTYAVIATFFIFASFPDPLISAVVPSLAFILSTLSIPFVKKFWLKYIFKK